LGEKKKWDADPQIFKSLLKSLLISLVYCLRDH
jgi:hypothetical protein